MDHRPQPERLHGLDALRASALLLGVLLHAAMAYLPFDTGWAVRDGSTHVLFSVFVLIVHSFRLEIFFLLAGFFGRLMHRRLGVGGFLWNRVKRILLPLALGWFVVYPGLCFAWIWGQNAAAHPPSLTLSFYAAVAALPKLFTPAHDFPLGHLWFLYYLAMVYATFAAARLLVARWPVAHARLAAVADAGGRRVFTSVGGTLLLALVSWPVLLTMKGVGVDTPDKDVLPHAAPLLLYGGCFVLGWMLHRQTTLLGAIGAGWRSRLLVAVVASVVAIGLVGPATTQGGRAWVAFQLAYALMMWGWALACLAAFIRFVQSESAVWRYLADASYWVYLIHLPIVAAAQVLLSRAPQSCWVKFAVVSLAGLALSLLTYHLLVRSTPIGQLLNGRRHPFRLRPSPAAAT